MLFGEKETFKLVSKILWIWCDKKRQKIETPNSISCIMVTAINIHIFTGEGFNGSIATRHQKWLLRNSAQGELGVNTVVFHGFLMLHSHRRDSKTAFPFSQLPQPMND